MNRNSKKIVNLGYRTNKTKLVKSDKGVLISDFATLAFLMFGKSEPNIFSQMLGLDGYPP